MSSTGPSTLLVLFRRRPGKDLERGGILFAEYDIFWLDGRPVLTTLQRFCQHGSRLLLGRNPNGDSALVQLTLYPVPGLEAPLTRPGSGIRCRRFYALRQANTVRLHFLNGTPTETVFDLDAEEPSVLRWLQVECMGPDVPFWFDLASQTISQDHSLAMPLPCGPEAAGAFAGDLLGRPV